MTRFRFILTVEGADVMTDVAQEALSKAGCDDATFGVSGGIQTAEFDREAAEFAEAAATASAATGNRPTRAARSSSVSSAGVQRSSMPCAVPSASVSTMTSSEMCAVRAISPWPIVT